MSVIKVYKEKILGLLTNRSVLVSQSGDRAKLHSMGEIELTSPFYDDDELNILDESVLLFLHQDVADDATVRLMYPDGVINTIAAWKLKVTCTEVIKVFNTGTTVDVLQMFISK